MSISPRFMIAYNPIAEPDGEYIYHSQQPRFLAKRVYGNPTADFIIIDDIDNMTIFFNQDPKKVAKLMRRLGESYATY